MDVQMFPVTVHTRLTRRLVWGWKAPWRELLGASMTASRRRLDLSDQNQGSRDIHDTYWYMTYVINVTLKVDVWMCIYNEFHLQCVPTEDTRLPKTLHVCSAWWCMVMSQVFWFFALLSKLFFLLFRFGSSSGLGLRLWVALHTAGIGQPQGPTGKWYEVVWRGTYQSCQDTKLRMKCIEMEWLAWSLLM